MVAVGEELHFRRAAERLGIAQPALSRTIRDIENELGVVLFRRTNRFVELTKAGEVFLESSRGVLSAVGHMVENTRQVAAGRIGTLRIGFTDLAISGPLPEIIKSLKQSLPDISLQFSNAVSIQQLRALEDGQLDIGFVTGPVTQPGLQQTMIAKEKFVCLVNDDHRLAGRKSVSIAELAGENFVHGTFKDWEVFFSHLLPLCHRNGFQPNIVQRGITTMGIIGLVSAGVGITILTESLHPTLPRGIKMLAIADAHQAIQTVMVWKPDRLDEPKLQFLKAIRQQIETLEAGPDTP